MSLVINALALLINKSMEKWIKINPYQHKSKMFSVDYERIIFIIYFFVTAVPFILTYPVFYYSKNAQ
jgi:hypothetical protein